MYKYKALLASQNFLSNILFPSCVQNLRRCFIIIQIQILNVFRSAENSKSIVYIIRSVDHEPPLFVVFTVKSSINVPGAIPNVRYDSFFTCPRVRRTATELTGFDPTCLTTCCYCKRSLPACQSGNVAQSVYCPCALCSVLVLRIVSLDRQQA